MNPDMSHNKKGIIPRFNGTDILRRKCKITNAYKSFSLIFPNRTLDITALSYEQCLFLMKGFSALCFHIKLIDSLASNSSFVNTSICDNNGTIIGRQRSFLTRDIYGRRSFLMREESRMSLIDEDRNGTLT